MFEASISELAEGLRAGRWTSRSLTEEALRRIAEIDQSGPGLNAIAEVNSDALWICLLYTSPSPRDPKTSRMPSSA